jgi:hypothetical protein
MKKCAKTVHITTWLLVLLTLQHHYIVLTIFSILMICLHQYVGAASTVTPIYWCYEHLITNIYGATCASSTNRRRHTNILKI